MGATPTYGFPYPELDDPDNVPTDMRELAEGVETDLAAEATARAAIDGRVTAETNARIAADNAEATTRGNADTVETNARIAGDNALAGRATALEATDVQLDARLDALEARNRTIGGRTLVSFVDGSGRLNFGQTVNSTISVVVNNSDGQTFNSVISTTGSWDTTGANLYGWILPTNIPLTRDIYVTWIAVVT